MIDLHAVYQNRLIPPGKYFVKVIEIGTDLLPGYARPRISLRLLIHPDQIFAENVTLVTIIHPYDTCRLRYQYFVNTFLSYHEDDPKLAMNRWGYVEVYDDKYEDAKYSNVKFIHQRNQVRMACALMNDQEEQGEKVTLPYQEGVLPAMPEKERSMNSAMRSLQAKQMALITEQVEDKWRKRPQGRLPK